MAVGSSNRSGGLCKLYGTTFNKSWRHCKPCDEINSICLMYLDYLDVCVTCAIVGQMPSSTCQVLRVCVRVSWMVCDCSLDASILETRFSEAGAAESLEIGKMAVGSSNRSGRLCKLYGTAFNKSGRRCKLLMKSI